jgi:hypothetical protein
MALTWTSRTSASDSDWRGVAWNGTVFAAVAYGGQVMTSPDGITWTSRTGTAGSGWTAIAWNGTVFCAIRAGISMTSPDGITWTAGTTNLFYEFDSIAWNGSLFCATCTDQTDASPGGHIMTSPTGSVWTSQYASSAWSDVYRWDSIAAKTGLFVAVNSDGNVMASPDGVTWTAQSLPSSSSFTEVAWDGTRFVILANSGYAYTSLTGTSAWTVVGAVTSNSAAGTAWRGMTGSAAGFVAVRSGSSAGTGLVSSSVDGLTWASDTSAGTNNWRGVACGGGVYVAIANTGTGDRAMTAPTPTSYAAIEPPIATVAAFGGGYAALTAPMTAAAAYGGGYATLAAPAARLAHAAHVQISAPLANLVASGHDSTGEYSATCTAPSPTLSAFSGANAELSAPSPSFAVTATVTNFGAAALSASAPLLIANGKVGGVASAYLTTTDPYKLAGYSGAVCSITLTGHSTLNATGTTGAIGGVTISCPLFELTASGTAQNYGSSSLLAPSGRLGATVQAWLMAPGATLTAIGHAVVTVSYEAYAVNLKHSGENVTDEVTHYTNYPFTQIVRYQNSYFGVTANGLYLLEGTTDAGAAISYAVKTAVTDFDVFEKKTISSAYFGGRIGPGMAITLYAGDAGQNTYNFTTPRGQTVQNYREKFGRGVKNRYYALGIAGNDVMELESIELDIQKLTRRI